MVNNKDISEHSHIHNLSLKNKLPYVKGTIGTCLRTPLNKNKITALILLDSGADINCIDKQFYYKNKDILDNVNENENVSDSKTRVIIKTPAGILNWHGKINITVGISSISLKEEFFIVDKLPCDMLLGNTTMLRRNIDLINSQNIMRIKINKDRCIDIPYENAVHKSNSTKEPEVRVLKLHALESLEIPPGCERLIEVSALKDSKNSMLWVGSNPDYYKTHIRTAYGIAECNQNNTINIAVANLGMETTKVAKGDVIAMARPINLNEFTLFTTSRENEQILNTLKVIKSKDDLEIDYQKCITNKEYYNDILKKFSLPEIKIGINEIDRSQFITLVQLLSNYKDIFAIDPDKVGHVKESLVTHSIDTGDAKPINQGPRRVSPTQRMIIKETIDRLLAAGIISPSRSPWSSPVLLVPKSDNPKSATDWRMCIDYRKLNEVTKKEVYAIPRTEDAIDALNGAKYFTTLDLASGYFQIAMEQHSKEKTAFITYDGQYQYNRMSFGLVNAPSTFQRCMDTVLAGLKWKCVQIYLDDAIIASPNFNQHLTDISQVLQRFHEAGFKLKATKCNFCCTEVQYLGHLISRDGVRADPDKIELIKNWPVPTQSSNLHSFVGLAGYYRKLINDFAQREAPLRRLLARYIEPGKRNLKGRNNMSSKEFKMNDEEVNAFNDLKNALVANPVLALPDFSGKSKFEMHTDASDQGISAILVQINPAGEEQVIHYGSRMLTKAELKWHTQEKEALAIVWGCNKFRSYLLGAPFIIRSDHQSLQWLMKSEKGRLARWALSMSEFDYKIIHRAGVKNVNADVASRWTRAEANEEWDPLPDYAYSDSIITNLDNKSVAVLQLNSLKISSEFTDLRQIIITAHYKDEKIKKVMELLLANEEEKAKLLLPKGYIKDCKLLIHQSMLSRVIRDSKGNPQTQILISQADNEIKLEIMKSYHDNLMAGHFGANRTMNQILKQYYWPSIRMDVKKYVNSCPLCQAHKSKRPKRFTSELNPSLPEGPNFRLSIDLIGPLPQTEGSYQYAIVIVDYFTKYVVTAPLTSKEGGEVAEAIFKYWYSIYGIPYEIQTDQGKEFANDLLKRLNFRMAVGHRITTPYYPQANGQVERFNQTLKNCIAIYAENKPGTWNEFLNGVSWAYNTSLHPITGFSPYYLMFGREPRLPMDVFDGSNTNIKFDIEQYRTKLTSHMRDAYKIVKQNLLQYAIKTKLAYDAKVKPNIELKVGERVLMYRPKLNKSSSDDAHSHVWIRDWIGPFTVISKKYHHRNDIYEIRDEVTGRPWTVNLHLLRPYKERSFLGKQNSELNDSIEEELSRDDSQNLLDTSRDALIVEGSSTDDAPSTESSDRLRKNVVSEAFRRNGKKITKKESRRILEREKDITTESDAEKELKEYEIEKILSHKRTRRGLTYEIKWVGYDEPTFEKEANFMTSDILKEYWVKIPIKERPARFRKIKVPDLGVCGQTSTSKKGENVGIRLK